MASNRTPSHRLTFSDAVQIWQRYISKEFVQRISAQFDCNVGRIYEVVLGELHPGSKEQAVKELEAKGLMTLSTALRAFIFKPKKAVNDNQLELFDNNKLE